MARQCPYRPGRGGIVIDIRLTPNAAGDSVEGVIERGDGSCALKVKVRAQPEKGKANQAAAVLLAKKLSFAKSDVSVVAGFKDRNKRILIAGDAAEIAARLETLIN